LGEVLVVAGELGQIACRVVEADRVLVVGALVENIEGARAAAAHDSGVDRAVGFAECTLADDPVPGRLAGVVRRWSRRKVLLDMLPGRGSRACASERERGQAARDECWADDEPDDGSDPRNSHDSLFLSRACPGSETEHGWLPFVRPAEADGKDTGVRRKRAHPRLEQGWRASGEHGADGPYACGSWHVGLLSGEPALAGRYPGSDVKHPNRAATQGAPWTWPRANPGFSARAGQGLARMVCGCLDTWLPGETTCTGREWRDLSEQQSHCWRHWL
jgi:hypothetical protein